MIFENNSTRIYLAVGPTDLYKSIDGLAILVKEGLNLDPLPPPFLSSATAKKDKLKILQWSIMDQGSVTPSHIRDFRCALQGRADKEIFITTCFFSRDAIKEAHRDGAPPIDLIDGDDLLQKMKELNLGVKKEVIEKITVDKVWFENT